MKDGKKAKNDAIKKVEDSAESQDLKAGKKEIGELIKGEKSKTSTRVYRQGKFTERRID
ncbi:MAG: hypothetical protein U0X87_07890 [Anaerolineales bacterium]